MTQHSKFREAGVPRSVATTRPDAKQTGITHYWLRLLVASDIIPKARLDPIIGECDQIIAILTTVIKKLKARQ